MRGQGEVCMVCMPPPQPDTTRYGVSMSGQHAFYWNAFLFVLFLAFFIFFNYFNVYR